MTDHDIKTPGRTFKILVSAVGAGPGPEGFRAHLFEMKDGTFYEFGDAISAETPETARALATRHINLMVIPAGELVVTRHGLGWSILQNGWPVTRGTLGTPEHTLGVHTTYESAERAGTELAKKEQRRITLLGEDGTVQKIHDYRSIDDDGRHRNELP